MGKPGLVKESWVVPPLTDQYALVTYLLINCAKMLDKSVQWAFHSLNRALETKKNPHKAVPRDR